MWNMITIKKPASISWLIVVLFLLLAHPQQLFAAAEDYGKFVTVADIHFDPFIGCRVKKSCPLFNKLKETSYQQWETVFDAFSNQQPASYFMDTNYALLKATIAELSRINQEQHPAFVLVLGDFLAHDFRRKYKKFSHENSDIAYRAFVKSTMQFISYELQKAFPTVDVYPVVGNNDTYTGDYSVIPNGQFLNDMVNTWSLLIKDPENRKSFFNTFSQAGYYEVQISHEPEDKIIILNTVLFSNNSDSKSAKIAAEKQLSWLHQALEKASQKQQRVIIACHIPLGIDLYDTIQSGFDLKELWRTNYAEKFIQEIKQATRVVAEILAAHIHTEVFKMTVPKKIASVPIYITPSVSPIFGNDPGLKIFIYEKATLQTKDVKTIFYYHPLMMSSKIMER